MFDKLRSAETLLSIVPERENNRWEWKSAKAITNKDEISKQVSAFANSGGGNLIFGISPQQQLEPCDVTKGRQPMKDWLAVTVAESVVYPIRSFRVHELPILETPPGKIFVIEIEDSLGAPHQSQDRTYYYRIDGHSKPAPHFHLELLRHRVTRAVLQIVAAKLVVDTKPLEDTKPDKPHISWTVTVKNVSLQAASVWGVLITLDTKEEQTCEIYNTHNTELMIRGERDLLPGESKQITAVLTGSDHLGDYKCLMTPVSQNHTGETKRLVGNEPFV